ncbi:MAG: hypothetical protein IJ448_00685 [Oscillospiraceae bacterium]|nr:hypothetical protein [Oscillospiraceae bacterium]
MKKLLFAISIVMFFALLLSACTGFNDIMYDHLSSANNYAPYRANVQELICKEDNTLIIKVTFNDYDVVRNFLGGSPNQEIPLNEYVFSLTVAAENVIILRENGFFDAVSVNDSIEVSATSFIYSDSEFFYVAAVRTEEKEYLDAQTGLQNIIRMMDDNRSIF